MTSSQPITDDAADHKLLCLANSKGKFGVPLSVVLPMEAQYALERGIDYGWFTFVDLSQVAGAPYQGLFKIYRLTENGHQRLKALKRIFGDTPDAKN